MLNKTFENFELKLVKLREESLEDFTAAESKFQEKYSQRLEEIFPRDILGAKKSIAGSFIVNYVDSIHGWWNIDTNEVFQKSVHYVISTLPLNADRKKNLSENILSVSNLSESLHTYFAAKDDISRDPFFALVEDFSIDWDISKEEFLLLQQSYESQWDFLKALEVLPESIRSMFHSHIEMTLSNDMNSKRWEFESEFSAELKALHDRGINTEPVIVFVSKSYYKTPGKYKKFEHPKRRLRRTFKIALLKLLRAKLWNIDAAIMLEKFEAWENFEDFFMLLFKLLEVVNEDPNSEEIYSILKLDEEIQDDVFTAEENKQKIIAWESIVMKIASLFSKWVHKDSGEELEDGILDKLLDESTDIIWEDIYFNREQENAWIYAESSESGNWDKEEEIDYDSISPQVAYEMLEHQFYSVEEEKRRAFLSGDYDGIDVYNEKLLVIESKLWKLCKVLWIEK